MTKTKELSSQRFEFLDGLRGLAAVFVVFFHLNDAIKVHSLPPFPSFLDWIFSQGHFGVEIFFVLSGFVIAYSIRQERISLRFFLQFLIRRSVRLDPPYWVIVGLLVTLSWIGTILFAKSSSSVPYFSDVLINLFYLPDFFEKTPILPVAWTLCLEIQFYLFFILLVGLMQSRDERISQCFLSFLMVASLLQNTPYHVFPLIPGLFLPYWYSFFMGSLLCWLMLKRISPGFFWLNYGVLLGYALLTEHASAVGTSLVVLTIYLITRGEHMHTYLSSCFFQYTGKISYSLYLTHWIIGVKSVNIISRFFASYVTNVVMTTVVVILTFLFSLVAADFFYRLIELPSLKLSQRLKKWLYASDLNAIASVD